MKKALFAFWLVVFFCAPSALAQNPNYQDGPVWRQFSYRIKPGQQAAFDEAIVRNLQVLDATAFALCRDQKLPIKVFSIFKHGALKRVVLGEDEGTLVYA